MSRQEQIYDRRQPVEIKHLMAVPDLDILVFSDSHNDNRLMARCMDTYPETGLILHLGDHESSLWPIMRKTNRPFLAVAGNCDWLTADVLPYERVFRCAGLGFYMCHGHLAHVKRGCGRLLKQAASQAGPVDLVLFGHTHMPLIRTKMVNKRPVTLANPGAAGRRFSTGTVTAMLVHIREHELQDIWHLNEDAKPFIPAEVKP